MNRNWLLVVFAGIIEIFWAMGLKHSDDLLTWSGTLLLIILSFIVLMAATKKVPVATAYAVFTGIGTAGTVLVEIIFFGEPFSWIKIGFILLLLVGVICLKLVTTESDQKEGAA
ncbi:multidrug efflux SMR transporter [Paenisporosarcina quisquiliarum]|uniref:Multidrug efflux SMR transporter n=1 Tax=Paenisporosarcina quisquiliarum TaxID=365346 RepID=A0A9X3LHX7_9BACL|nr:multidrug efflux SMR transporter [Paenisporosarcina quisquiliarum]MCZ8538328.1 multidrug efflux SMR transporter [Paenisporosarcina quisquiliarum]